MKSLAIALWQILTWFSIPYASACSGGHVEVSTFFITVDFNSLRAQYMILYHMVFAKVGLSLGYIC